MSDPPTGPLSARFEMMKAELLARQAATLAGPDGTSPPAAGSVPSRQPASRPEVSVTQDLREASTGRTATAPRPTDLGLPRNVTRIREALPAVGEHASGGSVASDIGAGSAAALRNGGGVPAKAAGDTTAAGRTAPANRGEIGDGTPSGGSRPHQSAREGAALGIEPAFGNARSLQSHPRGETPRSGSGSWTDRSGPPSPDAGEEDPAILSGDRTGAAAGRTNQDRPSALRTRMILELGRVGAEAEMQPLRSDGTTVPRGSSAPSPDDPPNSAEPEVGETAAAGPARAEANDRPRQDKEGLSRSQGSGPEPESAIGSGFSVTGTARSRPSGATIPPQVDPAGLALELALMVNAEMHKGWPTARFIPLLEKPRPPALPLEPDEDDASEDESSDGDEGRERSAGYEDVLAYAGAHAASRRLKRTLIFTIGCYCALLNILAAEILEYFADEVDEEIERNHDRA
jgi:hypothetical protein